ncbi:unnamed protein product [Ectocarpus sp. 12 AP-2014]
MMSNPPSCGRQMKVDHHGNDDARRWKRVRTLESSLGYSNLAFQGDRKKFSQDVHGAVNPKLPTDGFESAHHHRKRRLPSVGRSPSVQGSTPLREFGVSRSVPALLPSEEQSTPSWEQPAAILGCGNLPQLPGTRQEVQSNRSLEGPQENSMIETTGNGVVRKPSMDSSLSWKEELIGQPSHGFLQHTERTVLSPERSSKSHRSRVFSPLQASVPSGPECGDNRDVDSNGGVGMTPCVVLEAAEGTSRKSFSALSKHLPRNRDMLPDDFENRDSQRLVVKSLPSGKKLRTVRAGRCRSLVSPNNPFTSNAVVARVKQGFKNGEDETRSKVLIVGSGTFNPVHKIHIRRFYLARNYLEMQKGASSMRVVGGIVSPSHPTLVRQRHRVRAAEIIPPKHRLSMARAAVGKGSWLAVDSWEVTRKRIMDYMSVLEHAKEVCHETFPGHAGDITILYMCQASQIHHLNPAMLRAGGFGVITVCRPLEKERLLKELSPSFRNIAILVEDATILSAELEKTSSNMDNAFMFDQEDKDDRPYHNLPRLYVRRESQMPLHM